MSLQRKKIRNEVVDILRRANVVKDRFIQASRSTTYEAKNLPAISVYTRSEDLEERTQAPRAMRRRLSLIVEILVRDAEDNEASDQLDDLCERVEYHLTNDDSLDCLADDIVLKSISCDYEGEEFDKPVHSCQMVWEVVYRSFFPRDDRLRKSGNFEQINADWDLAGEGGDVEAQDQVAIPQS